MSSLRQPPVPKPPSDTESPASTDPPRSTTFRAGVGENEEISPLSSRFDKLTASGPISQRSSAPSGTMPAVSSVPSVSSVPGMPRKSSSSGSWTAVSAPVSVRYSKGAIYQATKILEKKHGSFFISRLILASGISLRGYDSHTADDSMTVAKFIKSLRNMLSPTDMADILSQVPSLNNVK